MPDPSLREVMVAIDGLRELIDERDRRYEERDASRRTAVEAALAAAKEQTRASFDASEKAIVKAESAQTSYNIAHNDLAKKMDDQNKATMPRTETEQRFRSIEEKISDLREAQVSMTGKSMGLSTGWALLVGAVGLIATLISIGVFLSRLG